MATYRRKYNYKRGEKFVTKESKFWTVEVKLKSGRLYRKGGFRDKAAAKFHERDMQNRIERGEVGMIDATAEFRNVLMSELIPQYQGSLIGKKRSTMYVYTAGQRLERLAGDCAWLTLGQISVQEFEKWVSSKPKFRGKRIGGKSLNQYLDTLRHFCRWCVQSGKLKNNIFEMVQKVTAIDNPIFRRAATVADVKALLSSAEADRKLLYTFVLYIPLRRGTLRQLKWGDVRLEGNMPHVLIRGETSKSRRFERSYIRKDLAEKLRVHRGKKLDDALVFDHLPTVDEIRQDWERAGVSFSDSTGNRRLDLHSFRKTAVKWMKAAGMTLEQVAMALHHKDLRTTKKHYDEDEFDTPLMTAVENMPQV